MKQVPLKEINVGDIFKFTKGGDQFVGVFSSNVDYVGINGVSCGLVLTDKNITETEEDLVWLVREYQ